MTLENLIGRGLESEPANRVEIERLLDKIATKLADAKVESISLETRFKKGDVVDILIFLRNPLWRMAKDKFGHALAYGLMTLLGAWAWSRGRSITSKGLLLGLISAMIFGVLMEVLQGLLTPHRQAEWLDLVANLAGGLLMCAVCLMWLKGREDLKARASHPPDNPRQFP